MVRKLSERTQAVIFLVALGTAIAGLYGWVQATQSPSIPSVSLEDVHLVVETPSWTILYTPRTTTNNTAWGILLEASQRLHFSLVASGTNGSIPNYVFVIAINSSANGQGGLYWQYWVNGVYGDRAANLYALHSNDTVAWRFMTSQEG